MGRGERLIKLGDSSYSPKCLQGQPRISFTEVELLIGCEGFIAYQFLTNSECREVLFGSESSGANVRRREGKSPDLRLRPLSVV